MKTNNDTENRLNEYISKREKIIESENAKKRFVENLKGKWSHINPKNTSDKYIKLYNNTSWHLQSKNAWNNILGATSQLHADFMFAEEGTKKRKVNQEAYWLLNSFFDKMNDRSMNASEYTYFENNSEKKLVRHAKKRITREKIRKLEKELK